MTRVSFLIPAYNAEKYIEATLASVLSGPRQDIEVVVVDDGSVDRTPALLSTIADPRLRVVRQANGGLPVARNTALRNARGEYVVFLDADDLFVLASLEPLTNALDEDKNVVLAYTNYTRFFDQDAGGQQGSPYGSVFRRPSGDVASRIIAGNFIGAAGACCIRASALRTAGPSNETLSMYEDWELFCRLSFVGEFRFVPGHIALRYRQSASSMSSIEGASAERFETFARAVFSNPQLHKRFSARTISQLRRSQLAHFHNYQALKAIEGRRYRTGIDQLIAAIHKFPPRSLEFIARAGWTALREVRARSRQT